MTKDNDDFIKCLHSDANLVEQFINNEIEDMRCVPERLKIAIRYATLGGGKRFRPFLAFESAVMLGADRKSILPLAVALECVHCYSLVHDDLPAMDNARLRRGRPTVWAAFDEWTAILCGDALLTLAFELLARQAQSNNAELYSKLSLELSRASGAAGMVGGQCLDLESDKLGIPKTLDAPYIQRMQVMKTGALVSFACEAGAILAGASEKDCNTMHKFGYCIGFAFQIADDLLDIDGTPEELGKATGKDASAGKATLVKILGKENARKTLDENKDEALSLLKPYGTQARMLREATHFITARKN
ncbi:MAG: Farnesyl diphosphate synthase [Hyphomicrobiaceae bacterium hypho_1]